MPVRLLILAVLCSLATCQSSTKLVLEGSVAQVTLDSSNEELGPENVLKRLSSISLECTMFAKDKATALQDPSVTWFKQGSNASMDSRYDSTGALSVDGLNYTSTLKLRRPLNEDVTNYTCNGTAKGMGWALGTAQMLSPPLVIAKVGTIKTFDVSVWPGQDLTVECLAQGNPAGSVQWLRKGGDDTLVSLQNSSLLNLTALSYDRDRGYLICRSVNKYGVNSAKIFLRVKHPQAYLPPLIIIIIEAVVLAGVVAGYEFYMKRKRAQREKEQGEVYKAD